MKLQGQRVIGSELRYLGVELLQVKEDLQSDEPGLEYLVIVRNEETHSSGK